VPRAGVGARKLKFGEGKPVKKKRILINSLKLAFGAGLFAWVIGANWQPSAGGNPGLGEALARPMQWLPLCLAAAFYLTGLLSTFIRWYFLVRAQDLPFTPVNAARLGLVGFSLNTLLPGSIGGDLFKAAFLAREQSRRTVAIATVLLDRAVGLWGLIWLVTLAGIVFLFLGNPALTANATVRGYAYTVFGTTGASLIIWFLLGTLPQARADRFAGRLAQIPRIGHSAAEFWRAFWLYRCKGASVAFAVLLAIFNHTCLVFAFYFAAHVFQEPGAEAGIPTLAQHFLLVPLAQAIQTLPLSPGGVGVGEFVYGKLYELAGSAESTGVLAALAFRLLILVLAMAGYLVYLRMKPSLPADALKESVEEPATAAQETITARTRSTSARLAHDPSR
jgi:uncharacterized membrane protein YbhN (UPF0104 family)